MPQLEGAQSRKLYHGPCIGNNLIYNAIECQYIVPSLLLETDLAKTCKPALLGSPVLPLSYSEQLQAKCLHHQAPSFSKLTVSSPCSVTK